MGEATIQATGRKRGGPSRSAVPLPATDRVPQPLGAVPIDPRIVGLFGGTTAMLVRPATAILAAAMLVAPAVAAGGPLQVTARVLTEQKVRAADGSVRVTLIPARKVVPGDRVVFVLLYRNTGSQPLGNVVLENPVPAGIAYRGPAPNVAAPEVSVDGKSYGPLAGLRVRSVSGVARAASPDDVTSVRWRLTSPVTAGSQGQLSFQAVLK